MRRWILVVVILLAGLALSLLVWAPGPLATQMPLARGVPTAPAEETVTLPQTPGNVSPLPSPTASPSPVPGDGAPPLPAPTVAEPETILTTQVPQQPSQRWGVPYELGTRFSTGVDGTVTAVRVYGAQTESGLHTVRIWRWDTGQVVAGPYEWEYDGPGWHQFALPMPLGVRARADYVVVVSTGTDVAHDFVSTPNGFDEPILNGHLVTYSGSGVATQVVGSMPTWLVPENRNYFRDIVFVPGAAAAPLPLPSPLTATRASSVTYYVASSGRNTWSGTLPAPNARGTDGPWRTIQHAADSTEPGDTVYVRAGTYHEWVWLEASDSGTQDAPKTFAAYPGEVVVLDGAAYPTDWHLVAGYIWWTDASDIDFNWEGQARLIWQDDVWLRHSPGLGAMTEGTWWFDTSTRFLYVWPRGGGDPGQHEIAVSFLRNAFHLNLASWIVLDGFHIVHYYRGVSQLDSIVDQGRHMEGLTVRNCVIEHVGEGIGLAGATFGTWGYTHRSRIENNVIRDTQSDAIWVGAGVGHVVRGNTISDVKRAWYRGFVSAAIILGNADDSIVEENLIYDVHALGIDVEHFYGGGYGNRNSVRRNTVHGVGGHAIAILGANDTQIENNVLYDVQIFGILISTEAGPALRNQVVNNTIYSILDRGIAVIEGSPDQSHGLVPQDTIIQNNILSNITHWGINNEGENTSADYNLYWRTQGGLAWWQGTTYHTLAEFQDLGQEAHGLVADPAFISPPGNLCLDETSPAIDAASNEWAPAVDYWGRPRPWDGDGDFIAIADIGAYEWTGPLESLFLPLILRRHPD